MTHMNDDDLQKLHGYVAGGEDEQADLTRRLLADVLHERVTKIALVQERPEEPVIEVASSALDAIGFEPVYALGSPEAALASE